MFTVWFGLLSCAGPDNKGPDPFPNERAALGRRSPVGFVANQDSDTVSVIDLHAFQVVAELPVGREPVDLDGPTSLVLDEKRDLLYVLLTYAESLSGVHAQDFAARRAGYVQFLARQDLRPLASFRLESAPYALALSPNGNALAVTHFDTVLASVAEDPPSRRASLGLLDRTAEAAAVFRPLCITPAELVFATDRDLYVACVGDDTVAHWDVHDEVLSDELDIDPTSPQKPVSLSLGPNQNQLAVSYEVTRELGILGLEPLGLLQTFRLPGVPQNAYWLSPSRILIPTRDPDELIELDLDTGAITDALPLTQANCRAPKSITSLDQSRFFLICQENHFTPGTLLELGVEPLRTEAHLELGLFPTRMVVDQR